MQATSSTYLRRKFGTQLFAAALALAGSGTMVGGSLAIAEHYAENAGVGHSEFAARTDTLRKIARNSCANGAS